MTPIPTTANAQSATSALSSAQSAEVQSLRNDSQRFQSEIDRLRGEEDKWNAINRGLAIAAVVIGGLLGLGSWAAQRKASVVGLSSRPVADKKDKTEARIRELLDQQSSLSIGNASTLAQGALERTAKAELKQAELTAINLELQSKLEGEKAARLTSEAKLLPRTVSVGQAKILKDALAKSSPHSLTIECVMNNAESCSYAKELAIALKDAGWFVDPEKINGGGYIDPPRGVFIVVPSKTSRPAKVLQDALALAGITAEGSFDPKAPPVEIHLNVGVKP